MEYFDHLQKSVVRRRYISRFMIDGEVKPMLAVLEYLNEHKIKPNRRHVG